jgi:hypothetical protein
VLYLSLQPHHLFASGSALFRLTRDKTVRKPQKPLTARVGPDARHRSYSMKLH